MAVYFDKKINTTQLGDISGLYYHNVHPILAVVSFSNGAGGSVNLYNKSVSKNFRPTIKCCLHRETLLHQIPII